MSPQFKKPFRIEQEIDAGWHTRTAGIVDADGKPVLLFDPSDSEYKEACSPEVGALILKLLNEADKGESLLQHDRSDDLKKLRAHLDRVHAADLKCPTCGVCNWEVGEVAYLPSGNGKIAMPLLPTICTRCFYTHLFAWNPIEKGKT